MPRRVDDEDMRVADEDLRVRLDDEDERLGAAAESEFAGL